MSLCNATPASIWGAFLCDEDGRIVRDFGDSISPSLLVDLTASGNLRALLENVRKHDSASGWEKSIEYEGSASRLLVHGAPIAGGVLVFATLTPCPACPELPSDVASGGKFNCPNNSGVISCPALLKQEEDFLRFVTAALHDLKNPISSILGSCEYLEGYCHDNLEPDQLEVIHAIQSAAATLMRLSAKFSKLGNVG